MTCEYLLNIRLTTPHAHSHDPLVPSPQNVEIICKNCWIKGEMAVSAGGNNIGSSLEPSENFTSPFVQAAAFDFSRNWVGFSVQSFAAHFEFEVTVTPVAANESARNDLVIHLLGMPLSIPVPLVRGNNQSKICLEDVDYLRRSLVLRLLSTRNCMAQSTRRAR